MKEERNAGPNSRRFRRLGIPALVIAIVLAVAGTFAVVQRGNGKSVEKPAVATVLEFSPADITLVELKELTRAIPLSGSLSPVIQSTVKSKVPGEVLKVLVQEGEQVKRGQVLVVLDTVDLRARLDSQMALLQEAKARWQIAAKNRDNSIALLKRNFISQNAVDTTQSTYDATVATVQSAEAQMRIARNALQDAVVRAPISGSVAKKKWSTPARKSIRNRRCSRWSISPAWKLPRPPRPRKSPPLR